MKTPDIYALMDDCRLIGEQIKRLISAIKVADGELDVRSSACSMSQCIALEELRANKDARLFKVVRQLIIVNNAVYGASPADKTL